ncbi:PTS mannose/fructose/sorbose transporter subunit IIAB [Jeotgalibaca sp. A127]|uniref:PTS mannose/fructose/sorbose transporter subunit IIAB n=1 Tax=Jeotgalibaca sp. A127 TaxID=3457324 RepID=UPI003FD0D8CF
MKNIVLVSHGLLAEGVKSSLEMIAGKQPNLHTISLAPDGDNLQFGEELEHKMKTFTGETIIIADLLGGTPANVSLQIYRDNPDVEIISGLSLPVALECVLGSNRSPDAILASAKETMVDLKASSKEVVHTPKSNDDALEKYQAFAGQANIVNARIDERLIHGQVAGIWSSTLKTQRLLVINDAAAENVLQKSSLRMAAPKSMRLSVLTVQDAVKNINGGKYGKQRLFLIFKNPTDVLKFIDLGGSLEYLTVGNMSFETGNREITKNIYITKEEEQVFTAISNSGVSITAQLVPNEPATDFMKKLTNKEK